MSIVHPIAPPSPAKREPFSSVPPGLRAAPIIGLALFVSGAAGLINQVVWQRALRVFLGGSETVCSMIVVLVFMAGLGFGSMWMGRYTGRLRNPLRSLGLVELILAVVNVAVCCLLASDLTTSIYTLQQFAQSVGLPLVVLYGVLALLVLAVPCLLMGATMPLAAESCQRNLHIRQPRVLGLLFGINTLGSVVGTVVSSGWMIAQLGQTRSLLLAALLNALAGLLVLALRRRPATNPVGDHTSGERSWNWRPTTAEVLAFGLGFCSLGYEMYLFRLVPLRHQPLPFTFAAVLAGFLLFWSIGATLTAWRKQLSFSAALRIGAMASVATIPLFVIDRASPITNMLSLTGFILSRFVYFVPCLFFGYLFSLVTQEAARSWGRDVGRIAAWNTLGSCLGTVVMTFVGYEIPFFMMVLAIALLMYAMQEYAAPAPSLARWLAPLALAFVAVAGSLLGDPGRHLLRERLYSGRDGVIFVTQDGNLIWDGLWHSALSRQGDHVGTRNWHLAVAPVLSHGTGDIRDVCVIGVCTGITVGTLAKLDSVERVDGYDITHVLKQIYRDYPDETLNIATNPKVNLIWQDARTGLALNPQKYDLIQAQPLYLKQSGSGQLNSVEFYRLVSQRLKPGGVFCLYSNGTPEQAFLVRETAAKAFPYRESFLGGYLLVLSNDPIDLSDEALARRLRRADPLWEEIRRNPKTATVADVAAMVDRPRLQQGDSDLVVTDDWPVVEYPEAVADLVRAKRYPFDLPSPR